MYDFPDVIRIEPSGACNFKCLHCSKTNNCSKEGSILSPELFKLLMRQLISGKIKIRVAVLYHGGEPLLNNYLFDFVHFLKKQGASIKFNSNASLLSEDAANKIVTYMDERDSIVFSFDGNSELENDSIRVNGNFLRDSQNVINLLQLMNEYKCKVNVSIANVQVCTEYSLLGYLRHNTALKVPDYLCERFRCFPHVSVKCIPAMVWPSYDLSNSSFASTISKVQNIKFYCPNPFETITIMANGDVVPCCFDINGEMVFGNIKNFDIQDIWASDKYNVFRDGIKNNKAQLLCKKCTKYTGYYLTK